MIEIMRPSQTSPKWANFNIRERHAADACWDLHSVLEFSGHSLRN